MLLVLIGYLGPTRLEGAAHNASSCEDRFEAMSRSDEKLFNHCIRYKCNNPADATPFQVAPCVEINGVGPSPPPPHLH